jgi:hypothetical protein
MPIIQVPHVLALDTAILAVWAHRWRRGDVRAHRLVEGVLRSKARLIMTLHHVNELTGHESDDVVESRARFVRSLQQLFLVNRATLRGLEAFSISMPWKFALDWMIAMQRFRNFCRV